jgi:hypothetical protein
MPMSICEQRDQSVFAPIDKNMADRARVQLDDMIVYIGALEDLHSSPDGIDYGAVWRAIRKPFHNLAMQAARLAQVPIWRYLEDNFSVEDGQTLPVGILEAAAYGGSLEIFDGILLDHVQAAELQAQDHQADKICIAAIRGGNVRIVERVCQLARPGWLDSREVAEPVLVQAIIGGNLDLLKLLRGCGAPLTGGCCEVAAEFGKFRTLRWLAANGAERTPMAMAAAYNAEIGRPGDSMRMYEWLKSVGWPRCELSDLSDESNPGHDYDSDSECVCLSGDCDGCKAYDLTRLLP